MNTLSPDQAPRDRRVSVLLAVAPIALFIACLLLIAWVLPTFERATGPGIITGEVTEFGVIGPEEPGRRAHFTTHSEMITAQLGSQFGFRFILKNVPAGPTVDLQTVVTHPRIVDKAGETKTHHERITTLPVSNGFASSVTGWRFDRPGEMTPGVWTFEHSYRGRVLVKQSFTVSSPDDGSPAKTP